MLQNQKLNYLRRYCRLYQCNFDIQIQNQKIQLSRYFRYQFSIILLDLIYQMSQNNCQYRNSVEKGEGLFALKAFKKGQIVYVCQIQQYDVPNGSHPSQVDMDKWVLFTKKGRSINHSCDPNCGIGFDGVNWSYKAFKDIKEGDQLCYDYAMANYIVQNFPNCLCGQSNCRGEIKGFRNLSKQKMSEYKGYFAPYLQKIAQQQLDP